MAMDMVAMGLLGTVVGASAMGASGVMKSMADSYFPGVMAGRDHKHQVNLTLQSQRHEALRHWRAGCALHGTNTASGPPDLGMAIRPTWSATNGSRVCGRICRPPAWEPLTAPHTKSTATIRPSCCSRWRSAGLKMNGWKTRRAATAEGETGGSDWPVRMNRLQI